jgi:hypothetical protein
MPVLDLDDTGPRTAMSAGLPRILPRCILFSMTDGYYYIESRVLTSLPSLLDVQYTRCRLPDR